LQLSDYYFDLADPCACQDIVYLPVSQLLNPSTITNTNTLQTLARTWSPNLSDGSSPGLTNADLADIAKADPFSNPSYVFTKKTYADGTCSTDGRFCLNAAGQISYQPEASPIAQSWSQNYVVTATEGRTTIDTHQVGYGVDADFSAGFLAWFNVDLKVSHTLTWQNKWSTLNTQVSGQSGSGSVKGPPLGYTGPTEYDIYQDNIYGTFMFYPTN
jgi:hypothetical protein